MLGLIGGGYWGKNLIREFYGIGVLKTVCDVDETALSNYKVLYPDLNTTHHFEDLLTDPSINMICVSLPAQMHYEYGVKVLNSGKHLYVEKPVTLNVWEAEMLNTLAKETNLTFMVGHLLHYHSAIIKIKYMLRYGIVGKIKSITSNRKSLGIYRTYENVLWSFGVHDISVVLGLCGASYKDLTNITCNGVAFITPTIYDTVNLAFHANEIYVNINVDWCSPIKEQRLTIVCEKGILVFDDVVTENKLRWFPDYVDYQSINGTINPVANKDPGININLGEGKSPLTTECEHFVNCCKFGTQPITNGDEALNVIMLLTHCCDYMTNVCVATKTNSADDSIINNVTDSIINNVTDSIINNVTEKLFYAHETSVIESDDIGQGTKIWRWSHVSKGAIIGNNCNIGQGCEIAGTIGHGCKVQNNVSIYKGVKAGNNVFFGPSCVLTNDINPRCEHPKGGHYMETIIEDCVTLGANCTIVCGITIGHHALIGAGAVITKNVEPYSIMVGNPGKHIGTIDEYGNRELVN